jgi:hypothetical protein
MKIHLLCFLLFLSTGIFAQGSGEVIITEYHNRPQKPTEEQLAAAMPNNPAGSDIEPNEGHTEWFEVYNTTDQDVVMDGWIIQDASSSSGTSVIGSFTLAAESYAVFSGFNIPEAQGGVEFDYFYDYKAPSFNNESSFADAGDTSCPDGVILMRADGSLVDEALYDYGYGEYIGNADSGSCMDATDVIGFPGQNGSSKVSFMLRVDPAVMNSAANDLAENWVYSTLVYDSENNQIGTPGLQNDGNIPNTGDFGSGEVIITEYYNRPLKPTEEQLAAALPNNPAGADTEPNEGHTEWFEVYNTTDQPVVMDGWTLTDASNNNQSVIESFTLEANAYAVFAGFNIPAAQGGIEFDYFYDYKTPSFNNESSFADAGDTSCPDGVIIASADGGLVDQVRYDYGYGEYIGNPNSGSCSSATSAIGIPAQESSSKVSFMLRVDPAVMNAQANDNPANWVFSVFLYDGVGAQIGSPGVQNDVELVSSTNDLLLGEEVGIYPNPASTVINLVSDLEETFQVEIYNLVGKRMSSVTATDRSIDVSQLQAGIYTLVINVEGASIARKIAIQR